MLVSELKESYPLVYQRLKDQSRHNIDIVLYEDVNSALVWGNSIEGCDFWRAVHNQNFDIAKKLQPHLFEKQKLLYKVVTNGLFKNLEHV